ncbi:unnamed protein product [Microthlaspi erraticum]|uniref:Uncharacterized protein n=1 Tax=Microthlaspi erraticum TaxID=1685480 RepID=A0A6D2K5E0_9BRAS|nr:unnamed protein product [Microthlaspi erraticum]
MQITICLASVYGAWTMRNRKWYFEVEKKRGGRMLCLRDGCTHAELVEIVVNDYMLQLNDELLELPYPLPTAMMESMPTDSPPMYITNDRQVYNLVELCKKHVLRLCVSTRVGMGRNYDKPIQECGQENESKEVDKEWEDKEFDDEAWDDNESDDIDFNDKAWDVNSEDETDDDVNDIAEGNDNPNDIDADYSKYGRVKDEKECNSLPFRERLRRGDWNGEGRGFTSNWCNAIQVNQSYACKEALFADL